MIISLKKYLLAKSGPKFFENSNLKGVINFIDEKTSDNF